MFASYLNTMGMLTGKRLSGVGETQLALNPAAGRSQAFRNLVSLLWAGIDSNSFFRLDVLHKIPDEIPGTRLRKTGEPIR